MQKISKQDRKEIAKLAKMLPVIPIAETRIVSGIQVLTDDEFKHLRNEKIDTSKKYKLRTGGSPVAVNHKRRIEKLYIERGIEAVRSYVAQFKPSEANQTIEA